MVNVGPVEEIFFQFVPFDKSSSWFISILYNECAILVNAMSWLAFVKFQASIYLCC
jgi:hypothetical protein